MVKQYVPDRGDLIWLHFSPQAGREQAGRRPALVLSPQSYNRVTGLCVVCPVTSRIKGYPFEVLLEDSGSVVGVILSDQIRNLDWKRLHADFIEKASLHVLKEVHEKLQTLIAW